MQYWIFPLVGFVTYTWNSQTNFPQLHRIQNELFQFSNQTVPKSSVFEQQFCSPFLETAPLVFQGKNRDFISNEQFYFFKKLGKNLNNVQKNQNSADDNFAFFSRIGNSLEHSMIENLNQTYLYFLQKKIFYNTNTSHFYNYSNNLYWSQFNLMESYQLSFFKNKFQNFFRPLIDSKNETLLLPALNSYGGLGTYSIQSARAWSVTQQKPSLMKGNKLKHFAKKILPVFLNETIHSDQFSYNSVDPIYSYHKAKILLENQFKSENFFVELPLAPQKATKTNFSFLKKQQNLFYKNQNKSKLFENFEKILPLQLRSKDELSLRLGVHSPATAKGKNGTPSGRRLAALAARLCGTGTSCQCTQSGGLETEAGDRRAKNVHDITQKNLMHFKTIYQQLNLDVTFCFLSKYQQNFPFLYANFIKENFEKINTLTPDFSIGSSMHLLGLDLAKGFEFSSPNSPIEKIQLPLFERIKEKKLMTYLIQIQTIQKKLLNLKKFNNRMKKIQYKLELLNYLKSVENFLPSGQSLFIDNSLATNLKGLGLGGLPPYGGLGYASLKAAALLRLRPPAGEPNLTVRVASPSAAQALRASAPETQPCLPCRRQAWQAWQAEPSEAQQIPQASPREANPYEVSKQNRAKQWAEIEMKSIDQKGTVQKRIIGPVLNAGLFCTPYPSLKLALLPRVASPLRGTEVGNEALRLRLTMLSRIATNSSKNSFLKVYPNLQTYLQANLNQSIRKKNSNSQLKIFTSKTVLFPSNQKFSGSNSSNRIIQNNQNFIHFKKIQTKCVVFLENLTNAFLNLYKQKRQVVLIESTINNEFLNRSNILSTKQKILLPFASKYSRKHRLTKLALEKKNLQLNSAVLTRGRNQPLLHASEAASSGGCFYPRRGLGMVTLTPKGWAQSLPQGVRRAKKEKIVRTLLSSRNSFHLTAPLPSGRVTTNYGQHKLRATCLACLAFGTQGHASFTKHQKKQILIQTLKKLKVRMSELQTNNQILYRNLTSLPLRPLTLRAESGELGRCLPCRPFGSAAKLLRSRIKNSNLTNQKTKKLNNVQFLLKQTQSHQSLTKKHKLSFNQTIQKLGFIFFKKDAVCNGLLSPMSSGVRQTKRKTGGQKISANLVKQKYFQKKRRRKKLKLENRRRKKRKRFYPRPIWLRYDLYRTFVNKRYNKNCWIFDTSTKKVLRYRKKHAIFPKTVIRSSAKQPAKTIGRVSERNPKHALEKKWNNGTMKGAHKQKFKVLLQRNNKQKWGNLTLDTNDLEKNSLKKYILSTNLPIYMMPPAKNYYKISNLLQELMPLYWKSYWLRTNLKPYMNRIEKNLDYEKFITKNHLFSDGHNCYLFLSNLVGDFLSISTKLNKQEQLYKKTSFQKTPISFYSNKKNSFQNIDDFSFSNMHMIENMRLMKEHDRILFDRISEIIKNIKYNLTLDGENSLISYKLPKSKYNLLNNSGKNTQVSTTNSLLNSLKSSLFQQLDPNFSLFSAFNFATLNSEKSTILKPYASPQGSATLRVLWALNKTNLFSFKEKNSIKNLWETYKNAEQSKSNQTKKFFKKTFTYKIQTVFSPKSTSGKYILRFSKKSESSFMQKQSQTNNSKTIFLNNVSLKKFQNVQKKIFYFLDTTPKKKLFFEHSELPATSPSFFHNRVGLHFASANNPPMNHPTVASLALRVRANTLAPPGGKAASLTQVRVRLGGALTLTYGQPLAHKEFGLAEGDPNATVYLTGPLLRKSANFFWWSSQSFFPYFIKNFSDSHILKPFYEIQNLRCEVAPLKDNPYLGHERKLRPSLPCLLSVPCVPKARHARHAQTSFSSFIAIFAVLFHLCIFMNLLKLPELRNLLKFQLSLIYKVFNIYLITLNSFHTSVQKFQTKIKQSFLNFHLIAFSHKGFGSEALSLDKALSLRLTTMLIRSPSVAQAQQPIGGYSEAFPRTTGFLSLPLSPNWQNLKIRTKLLSTVNSFDNIKRTQRSSTLMLLGMATNQKPFMYSIKKKNSSDHFNDFQSTFLSFQIQKISFLNLFKISRSSLVPLWFRENHSKNWVTSPSMNPPVGGFNNEAPPFGSAAKVMDVGKTNIQSYLFQKYSKNTNSYESLTDQKVQLFESMNQNYLSFFLTIASRFVVGSSIHSIQLSYKLVLKIIEIIESFLLFIYKFLEKPAELMIESIAQLFLIEWISDICTFIPETLDKNLWESFQKFSGSTHFLATLYSNSAVSTSSAFDQSKSPSKGVYETVHFLATIPVSLIFLNIIKQFYYGLWELLLKPDMDLVTRQKKGIYFMNIWAEIFIQAAEKYQLNVASLVTNNSEQEKFMERLLKDPEIFSFRPEIQFNPEKLRKKEFIFTVSPYLSTNPATVASLLRAQSSPTPVFPPLRAEGKARKARQAAQALRVSAAEAQPSGATGPGKGHLTHGWVVRRTASSPGPVAKGKGIRPTQSLPSLREGPAELWVHWHEVPVPLSLAASAAGLRPDGVRPSPNVADKEDALSERSVTLRKFEPNHSKNFISNNSISINQHIVTSCFGGQYTEQSDLFLDIAPPKSFQSISYLHSPIYFIIGPILCEVYSGLFSKKISKNILLVTKKTNLAPASKSLTSQNKVMKSFNSSNPQISNFGSFLIEALAGETEMKLIIDNAKRYSLNFANKAIGIRLLKDVFMSIALQTPSFYMLEDIHFIAERRPMLIGNSENTSSDAINLVPPAQDEIHFQNQSIYELSRHKILDYKRPYKGDSSFIPANIYSQKLYAQPQPGQHKASKTHLKFWAKPLAQTLGGAFKKQKKHPFSTYISPNKNNIGFSENPQKMHEKTFLVSRLQLTSEEFFAAPSTSPFTILLLKDQKKMKFQKASKYGVSWFKATSPLWGTGDSGSSELGGALRTKNLKNIDLSIRSKIAELAHMTLRNFSGSVDMITDLLVIVDSVRSNRGFVVFATTPVPSILDPALRRPGRFDETLCLPEFNLKYESQILPKSYAGWFALPPYAGLEAEPNRWAVFGSDRRGRADINILAQSLPEGTSRSTVGQTITNQNKEVLYLNSLIYSIQKNPQFKSVFPNFIYFKKLIDGSDHIVAQKHLFKILFICSKFVSNYLTQVDLLKNQTNQEFNKSLPTAFALPLPHAPLPIFGVQSFTQHADKPLNDQSGTLAIQSRQQPNLKEAIKNTNNHFTTIFSSSSQYKNSMLCFLAETLVTDFFNCGLRGTPSGRRPAALAARLSGTPSGRRPAALAARLSPAQPFTARSSNQRGVSDTSGQKVSFSTRITRDFIYLLLEKRYLLHKNFIVSKMLCVENLSNSLKEPPGPPISEILMPSKKYEAFKTTEQEFILKNSFSIYEKMHSHQKQRFLKKLYNQPIQIYFKSLSIASNFNDFTTFVNSFKELSCVSAAKNSKTVLLKGSSTNYYYKTRFLMKHRFSLMNQWWNAQLPEHNIETTFLSDVDWRSMYLQSNQKSSTSVSSKAGGQKSQQALGLSLTSLDPQSYFTQKGQKDQFIDFPDADQHYNPRIRKWILNHHFSNIFNFENIFTYEIYYNFLMQSFFKIYNYLDQNRELLDYSIYNYLDKGSSQFNLIEFTFTFILSRFYKK